MTIYSEMVFDNNIYQLKYTDVDSFIGIDREKCQQIYGFCFYKDRLIIGLNGKKKTWGLIGGTIEQGETIEQTLKREVIEESNMKVLKSIPIGYQEVTKRGAKETLYQLRSCCLVEPIGPFISDPAGSVTEIKNINPLDYKNYFDWGEIGERLLARALELREKIN